MISLCKINVSVRPRTYKPGIGNCLLKLQSYFWRLARKARLLLRSYQLSASTRRSPATARKYDHTTSTCSGGLWPLSCQQLGANKEMHILDNSQTLNPLIWWH